MALRRLNAVGIGPIDPLAVDFGSRLNLLTGDNGLGKSLILDLAFWQLTGSWPKGLPYRPTGSSATVSAEVASETADAVFREASFDQQAQRWRFARGRPPKAALVVYAQSNGDFAVWDPARNYYRSSVEGDDEEAPRAFLMNQGQVWEGLPGQREGSVLCNGLIRDWVVWQKEQSPSFNLLRRVLAELSPPDEPLQPGDSRRLDPDDSRDFPMLRTFYGEVPAMFASEAVRRIVGLAYLLVWTWSEHQHAARLRGWSQPFARIVVLVDEIEAHLHPRWQRSILPSLLAAVDALSLPARPALQVVAVTHAPLLLASLETLFDPELDRLLVIEADRDVEPPRVRVRQETFRRMGDASSWLTSDVFDLASAVSREAESARQQAIALLASGEVTRERYHALDERLRHVLAESDPFWSRWRYFGERKQLVSAR
jgi:hypothetical protein